MPRGMLPNLGVFPTPVGVFLDTLLGLGIG